MKFYRFFILTIAVTFVFACTPKSTEKIVKKKPETTVLTAEQKACRTFAQLGNRKTEALESFVLYKDLVKTDNFKEAYPLWTKAFHMAPGSDGSKTYHYDDGVKIFKYFHSVETDLTKKKMWADSVKYLYKRRANCFGEPDYLAAREGFDMYYSFSEEVGNEYIFEKFKQSADALGNKLPYFAINPFTKIVVDMMADESISKVEASKYAMLILGAIKYGNDNCGTDCATWEIINSYAPVRLEALEGYADFYDCDYYYTKYYPEYEANPRDCEIIEKVGIRLRRGGCDINGTAIQALATAYKANCKSETVTVKGPLGEAFDLYKSGKYNEAVAKFDEYFASESDSELLAKYKLTVAKIYYRDIKNFPKSREYALAAATHKGSWGAPYILIGKLYASSGPICGPGTGWDSQIVTWPAIDKWQYAKSIDSSVSGEASNLIGTYQKYMPDISEIFSRTNVKEGGPFYVGCWIKENTTARAAK